MGRQKHSTDSNLSSVQPEPILDAHWLTHSFPLRISENEHKKIIEDSPPDSRIVVCAAQWTGFESTSEAQPNHVMLPKPGSNSAIVSLRLRIL